MQIRFRGVGSRPALFAATLALAAVALPVTSASATTKGGTSTTSVVSSSIAVGTSVNDSVTFTVDVTFNGSVTGNQYVDFYDGPYDGTGKAPPLLGTAKLYSSTNGTNQTACTTNSGSGNKTICTATFVLSGANTGLSSGYNQVEAYYPGDNFIGNSWDAANLYSGTDNYCTGSAAKCQATDSGNLSSATFSGSSPLSGTEDVVLAFAAPSTSPIPGCSVAQASDQVAWSLTGASGATDQLSYTILGKDATSAETIAPTTSFPAIPGHMCFESTQPFTAWSSSGPVAATQATDEDGNLVSLYYGQLGPCPTYAAPCIDSVSFVKQEGKKPAQYTQVFTTNTTDPRGGY